MNLPCLHICFSFRTSGGSAEDFIPHRPLKCLFSPLSQDSTCESFSPASDPQRSSMMRSPQVLPHHPTAAFLRPPTTPHHHSDLMIEVTETWDIACHLQHSRSKNSKGLLHPRGVPTLSDFDKNVPLVEPLKMVPDILLAEFHEKVRWGGGAQQNDCDGRNVQTIQMFLQLEFRYTNELSYYWV